MSTAKPSIAFFGTPDLAVFVLEELKRAGMMPNVIVTAPDRPAGRSLKLTQPPVRLWADEHDIAVIQPAGLTNQEEVPELGNSEWDLFIVAAYNVILPEWLLAVPKKGVLNVHPSLLPKLRGPSPIRTAIRKDVQDAVGVTILALDTEVDHGPIVAQARVELPEWPVKGRALDELLFREGGRLLAEVIPLWLAGEITPEEQEHDVATTTHKIRKADGEINLTADAYDNYLSYCAMDGWPGTFFFIEKNGKRVRVKVVDAQYVSGSFTPVRVIPEGKHEMSWTAFLGA